MKKKIVVPVDFSKTSEDAYLYAREMAKVNGAAIEIVHVYKDPLTSENPYIVASGRSRKEMLQDQLDTFVQNIPSESGGEEVITKVTTTAILIQGETTDELINKSKEEDTILLIMGNRGKHRGVEKIFGSISSVVAQNAVCPVILIPPGTRYESLEQVLFATNYESADQGAIDQITSLANTYRASLHFLHISKENEKEDFNKTMDQIVENIFHSGDPAFSLTIDTVNAESILDGLYNYSIKHSIDLIVLVNRERSFLKNVLGRSTTQKIAADLEFPVLVYHMS